MKRPVVLLAGAIASVFVLHIPVAEAGEESVVYSFCKHIGCRDGEEPQASVINVKGTLYGTTFRGGANTDYEGGTVFSVDPATGAEKVIYSFCSQPSCADGENPQASLIDVNSTLYGTTTSGGVHRLGTVFALDPNTGAETVLYSFCSQQNCTDGEDPEAGVIDVEGTLYGTTFRGGAGTNCGTVGCGTVFALDVKTGIETVLYSFAGGADGANPSAGLIDVKGKLYGTTGGGGAQDSGTVFSIDTVNGHETVLYSFCSQQNCTDGAAPYASVIDVNGTLFGTTFEGGANNRGTLFSIDLATGAETVVYAFIGGPDGELPAANVIDVNGMLYGTTVAGGRSGCFHYVGCGTVFSVDPPSGAETELYSFFDAAHGKQPNAGLIHINGTLYGTTPKGGVGRGGDRGGGTVFKLKL